MAAYDFEMAFDPSDGYVLLVGAAASGHVTGHIGPTETWKFQGGSWARLHPAAQPANCAGSALTYDDADRYVVYLGAPNWPGRNSIHCSSANETWIYSSGNWTLLHPSSTPGGRYGAALTNDSKDGYVLLFGGMTPSGLWNDTWKFVGGNWTKLHPHLSPSAREEAGLAYDVADGYVLMFGGVNSVLGPPGLNDTWRFVAGAWTHITTKQTPPGPEPDAFSYDAVDHEVVYTTAENWSGPMAEISWTYRGGNWTQVTSAGTLGPDVPVERLGAGSAMDYVDGYVLFSGGLGWNDSWSFRAGTWSELSAPPGRTGAVVVDDPSAGFVLMFGGTNGQWALNDSWAWTKGTWRFLDVAVSPPARAFASAAYDPAVRGVVLFGGLSCYGPSSDWIGTCSGGELNDTWVFVGGNWTRLPTSASPSARAAAAMAFDVRDRALVLMGGYSGSKFLGDTWRLAKGAWTLARSATAPSSRAGASAAYDPSVGAVVLFGGVHPKSTSALVVLNDTWSYHSGAWTLLSPATAPAARANASLAFDPRLGGLVLFGGSIAGRVVFGDTWLYRGNNWTALLTLTTPAARGGGAFAYTPSGHYAILFGGASPLGILVADGTWRLV